MKIRDEKISSRIFKCFVHVFLILLVMFQLFPVIAVLFNSLRHDSAIKALPLSFPESFYLGNYPETWIRGGYATAFISSIRVGLSVVIIVVICAGLAGYALSRLNIPGKNFFISYFLLGMAIPAFLYIAPTFFTFARLGLVNTHLGLIIIYSAIFLPFNILLMRTFMLGIPRELEEAALVDGCNETQVLLRITTPLAKPIITTIALITFLWTWNEFMWANTFISSDALRTVATRFFRFVSEYSLNLALVFTAGAISLGPILILYLFLQKAFIEGMTQGAVKG